jgi:MoaA/NifB/PqqE/SkfB family radical SAM enzyme
MDVRLTLNLLTDRVAALPLAIVYVTDRCNSKCVTCDYWKYGQTNFPVERAQRLAPELKNLGVQVVLLSGGEPLLHPRWADVAAPWRAADLRLWLLTSGLSLHKHAPQVTELCERVTVSLDGATPETYHAIRGVDAFDAVCAGIRAVVKRGVPVSIRSTVQRGNYQELPALVRLAHELGVTQISFLAVDVSTHLAFARQEDYAKTMALQPDDLPPFAAVLDSLEHDFTPEFASGFIAESPEKLRRLHQYFSALHGLEKFPPVRCNAPRFSAVIGADGHLQPCYFIPGVAKLNGGSLSESLNTPESITLRRDIREGQRSECKRCVCSMWRGARELMVGDW